MSEPILLDTCADGIRRLTLNRPARKNALSAELVQALVEAFRDVATDPATRVVVLTGAGDTFCSGGDLNPAAAAAGPFALHRDRTSFAELLKGMRGCGKPIIARVNGHALAGGCGLAVNCDLAIAASDVQFGTPELKVGLFPMMITAVILRNVGRKKAMELLLTGDRWSADEAERYGLINRSVPREQLDEAVDGLARKLSAHSSAVLRLGRDAIHEVEDLAFDPAVAWLASQLTINSLTEDAAEGIMAFVTRRPPEWKDR